MFATDRNAYVQMFETAKEYAISEYLEAMNSDRLHRFASWFAETHAPWDKPERAYLQWIELTGSALVKGES